MKCKNCNAEWNVSAAISASLSECPFCKVSLIEEKAKRVFYNLHDALAAMYADPKAGIDVVLGSKCPEYIPDYFPNIKPLVKARIKTISKSGGAAEILKSAMNADVVEKERAILLAIQKLTDDGDGKDTATDIIYEYVSVLGWNVFKPQAAIATQQDTNTKPQPQATNRAGKISRSELCPCGSGKKYENCCDVTQFSQPVAPGDKYSFGNITWCVLEVQGDRALLLTEDIVEKRVYNIERKDVTWESCSLRQYLNGEFYNRFTSKDRVRILPCTNSNENTVFTSTTGKNINTRGGVITDDRIFLLNIEEAKRYFNTSDVHFKTYWNDHYSSKWDDARNDWVPEYIPHSDKLKATYKGEAWWWWLRSPGDYRYGAAFVSLGGALYMLGYSVDFEEGGVRPALWLNLKS